MQKNKYDVLTIGSAVRDIMFNSDAEVIHVDKPYKHIVLGFQYGAKLNVDDVFETLGGGACNTGVDFSRLGYKVAVYGIIGEDINGQAIIERLKKEKIQTNFLIKSKNKKTAFSVIITSKVRKEKEHVIFHHQGAANDLDISMQKLKTIKPRIIYLCSLRSKKWKKIIKTIVDYKKIKNIFWSWNPGNTELFQGKKGLSLFLKNVDVLQLNKKESIDLLYKGKSKKKYKIEETIREIYKLGPKIVVITDGIKGVYAYDGQKIYFSKSYKKVKTIDTTGVGDAFGSTFTFAYNYYKGDIKKGLKAGVINAGYVSSQIGAQNGALSKSKLDKIVKSFK